MFANIILAKAFIFNNKLVHLSKINIPNRKHNKLTY